MTVIAFPTAAFPAPAFSAPAFSVPAFPVPAAPRTRLRLTRRGRAVLSSLIAAPFVVGIVAAALGGASATATSSSAGAAPASITVEAGQSLWAIAAIVAPEANPADVVADIIALNELAGGSVQAGQSLVLPERYAR